jgi:hypothetical protein
LATGVTPRKRSPGNSSNGFATHHGRRGAALEDLTDDEVFSEIQSRRSGTGDQPKTVEQAELETLLASKEALGNDKPDGYFFARTLPRELWDKPWMAGIERIVLVHQLRGGPGREKSEHGRGPWPGARTGPIRPGSFRRWGIQVAKQAE